MSDVKSATVIVLFSTFIINSEINFLSPSVPLFSYSFNKGSISFFKSSLSLSSKFSNICEGFMLANAQPYNTITKMPIANIKDIYINKFS